MTTPEMTTPQLCVEVIKICGAGTAFIIATYQYVTAQKWKRREFVAAQVRDFKSDKWIAAGLTILDWSDRKVAFPNEIEDKPFVFITHEALLCAALLPHSPPNGYSTKEALLRDCFDRLLDGLVMFQNFIEARLISVDELRPYMNYWLRSISGETRQHTPQFYLLLHNYINVYGFKEAAQLLESFGYRISAPGGEVDAAIESILAQRLLCESD